MSDRAKLKVKYPDGEIYEIDPSELEASIKAGGSPKLDVIMRYQDGEEYESPPEDIPSALNQGGKPVRHPELSDRIYQGVDASAATIRGAAANSFYGFGDRIKAGLGAGMYGAVKGVKEVLPEALGGGVPEDALSMGEVYDRIKEGEAAKDAKAKADYPILYGAGAVLGATVGSPTVPGTQALGLVGKGAIEGGLTGAGYSQADTPLGVLKDSIVGGTLGGVLGKVPVAPVIGGLAGYATVKEGDGWRTALTKVGAGALIGAATKMGIDNMGPIAQRAAMRVLLKRYGDPESLEALLNKIIPENPNFISDINKGDLGKSTEQLLDRTARETAEAKFALQANGASNVVQGIDKQLSSMRGLDTDSLRFISSLRKNLESLRGADGTISPENLIKMRQAIRENLKLPEPTMGAVIQVLEENLNRVASVEPVIGISETMMNSLTKKIREQNKPIRGVVDALRRPASLSIPEKAGSLVGGVTGGGLGGAIGGAIGGTVGLHPQGTTAGAIYGAYRGGKFGSSVGKNFNKYANPLSSEFLNWVAMGAPQLSQLINRMINQEGKDPNLAHFLLSSTSAAYRDAIKRFEAQSPLLSEVPQEEVN